MLTNVGKPAYLAEASDLPRGVDLILLHGKVWTGESTPGSSATRIVEAVAIANGRILAVGSDEEIRAYAGPNTTVIDLKGRLAVPGLSDSHAHFIQGGFQLLSVDLKDARSEEEFVRRVAEKARILPPGRWMQGGDWDEEAWPSEKLPTRWLIDAVTPRTPVFISRYDGHAVLANSLAFEARRHYQGDAGPGRGRDCPGSKVRRAHGSSEGRGTGPGGKGDSAPLRK